MEESGAGPSPTEDGGAVGLERRPALFDALLITPRRRPGQVAHRRRQAAQDRPLRHAIPSQLRDVSRLARPYPAAVANPAGIDPGMVADSSAASGTSASRRWTGLPPRGAPAGRGGEGQGTDSGVTIGPGIMKIVRRLHAR